MPDGRPERLEKANKSPQAQAERAFLISAMNKPATYTMRVEVAPWVAPFIAIMVRLSQTERFKATICSFVNDHGVTLCP